MKKTIPFTLCLSMVFLSMVSPAFSDTAFLQLDRNEYYETSEVSFNMEDMINTTHLYDFSLNGYHGNKSSSLSSVTGYFGEGLSGWDASNGYNVTVPDIDLLNSPYTIMMWIYPTLDPTYDSLFFSDTGDGGHFVRTNSVNDSIAFSGGLDTLITTVEITNNIWTHITCVYDSSNATHNARIYFNGSLVSPPISLWRHRDWNTLNTIGDDDDALNRFYWNGIIDEFRIYREVRTVEEIQTDMETPIALELTVEDLEPNEDIVQLWFENDTLFEQQTANSNGTVQFNVWTFSDKNSTYNGVLNIYHEDIQYEGYVMVLNWGDVYSFLVLGVFEDLFYQFFFGSGAWLGLIVMLAIMFITSVKVKYVGSLFGIIAIFLGVMYFVNIASNDMFMWSGIVMFLSSIFLIYLGLVGSKK